MNISFAPLLLPIVTRLQVHGTWMAFALCPSQPDLPSSLTSCCCCCPSDAVTSTVNCSSHGVSKSSNMRPSACLYPLLLGFSCGLPSHDVFLVAEFCCIPARFPPWPPPLSLPSSSHCILAFDTYFWKVHNAPPPACVCSLTTRRPRSTDIRLLSPSILSDQGAAFCFQQSLP